MTFNNLCKTYLHNINHPEYKNYLDSIKLYYRYKEEFVNNKDKRNFIKEDVNVIEVYKRGEIHLKIHKPKYQTIEKEIHKIRKNQLFLLNQIDVLIIASIFDDNDTIKVKTLEKSLQDENEKLYAIYKYFLEVNQKYFEKNMKEKMETQDILRELYKKACDEKDTQLKMSYLRKYLVEMSIFEMNFNKKLNNDSTILIDFIIEILPKVENITINSEHTKKMDRLHLENKVKNIEHSIKENIKRNI